jgi:hypothetical protein
MSRRWRFSLAHSTSDRPLVREYVALNVLKHSREGFDTFILLLRESHHGRTSTVR